MNKGNRHGSFFLTIEGGEGAGKSSLIEHLSAFFFKKGFDVVTTREPGGAPLGEKVRALLLDSVLQGKIAARAELLLFLAARAQHVEEVIDPALAQGKVVICDRFHDSTIAYQGMGRGLGFKGVEQLCLFASQGLVPDLTLFLDVEPQVGLARAHAAHKGSGPDRIESEEIGFHDCVRRGFLLLAEQYPQRITRLDASQQAADVVRQAIEAVEKKLRSKQTAMS